MPLGLTEKEEAEWCKTKAGYKPLLKIPKAQRTEKQQKELRRKAEEYRDWHRYQDIKKGKIKYSPKHHTSKIFDEFKEGGA